MLTIIKKPELIALAGDPVVFKINSNNYILSNGSNAVMKLYMNSANIGEYIEIYVNFIAIRMTAVANPDNSGTQFKAKDALQTKSDWLTQTITYFNENFYLSSYFSISLRMDTTLYIHFTAKKEERLYLSLYSNTIPGSTLQITDGANTTLREFYSILIQLWMNEEKKCEYELPVDSEGNAFFDVSTIINGNIEAAFEFPETSAIVKQSTMCSSYHLRYAERYGIETTTNKIQKTEYLYAIGGGLADYKQQEFYNANTGFYSYLKNSKAFLNWHPGNKTILFNQTEKLYYLFLEGFKTVYFIIKAYANDALIQTIEIPFTPFEFDMYEFHLNPLLRGLSVNTEYFYAYIEYKSTGLILSEIRRYNIDYTEYPNKRLFLFKNSLNCYETVLFTGVCARTSKYTREFAEFFQTGFNPNIRKKRQVDIQPKETFKASSSWLSFKELAWINELLISDDVYEIRGNRLFKVLITSNSVEKDIDNNFNYSIQIEFEYDGDGNVYPCDVEQNNGDFNSDYNYDFVI